MANDILGYKPLNFAKLILQQDAGQFMNSQMTSTFYKINKTLSEITASEETAMEDELDFEYISKLSITEIDNYYKEFCLERMTIGELK